MARYVLSHRRAGINDVAARSAGRERASTAFAEIFASGVDLVGAIARTPENRREVIVFEASPDEVEAKRELLGPDVFLEPEILHFPARGSRPDRATLRSSAPDDEAIGTGRVFEVTVCGPARPLADVAVMLTLRAGGRLHTLVADTDGKGEARFEYGSAWQTAALVAVPPAGHWSMFVKDPTTGLTIEAPELPRDERTGWWHRSMGIAEPDPSLGAGVTVGVVDTGLGPHPYLGHMKSAGSFLDGNHQPDPAAGRDVDLHGTHVCGTIGARPPAGARYPGGVAPAADVVCARVFGPGESGANQGDIADAIEHLSLDWEVDLVNLSLGAAKRSEIAHDAVLDVLEAGTLCVCAAANSGGAVQYPAAFDEAIAVSALGLRDWAPAGTLSASRLPASSDRYGLEDLYLANFSCFGDQIDCAAPGVGIVATVPVRLDDPAPYAVMDGTSMASPSACGALAAALGRSADYLDLPRDHSRSARARAVLDEIAHDIGLAPPFQGRGLPRLAFPS